MLGKGIAIWDLTRKQLKGVNIPQTLLDLGMSWVTIKMTDGQWAFNRRYVNGQWVDDLLPPLVEAIKKVGIRVWGWGFSYLGYWAIPPKGYKLPKGIKKNNGKAWYANGKAEGKAAADRVKQFDLDGWMIDVESNAEDAQTLHWDTAQAAFDYLVMLRGGIKPGVEIALNSFRHPLQHHLPWKQYYNMIDMHMPQVYWVGAHNAAQQLINSYDEITKHCLALSNRKLPYVPEGSAYGDEHSSWAPTPKDIKEFADKAHQLNMPGISYWALDESGGPLDRPELYAAIKADVWNPPPTPPDVPPVVVPDLAFTTERWERVYQDLLDRKGML